MAARARPLEHPAQQDYEKRLIQRIRDGEHDAFYVLIRPYEKRVYAAALALLRNQADAEDCAQDAVLKAFKNIRQFRSEKFSTWLIQIAVNEARMRRRKQRTDLSEPIEKVQGWEDTYAPREFADWREIPSETLERKEVRERLVEALSSIGQIYHEVFVLRDMDQLSIEETAKALGISTASVRTRLLRARLMLRDFAGAGTRRALELRPIIVPRQRNEDSLRPRCHDPAVR